MGILGQQIVEGEDQASQEGRVGRRWLSQPNDIQVKPILVYSPECLKHQLVSTEQFLGEWPDHQ